MRVHIGGKISRFSLLNMTITEAKKNYGGNWHSWVVPMSGENCKKKFVLQGVQKNYKQAEAEVVPSSSLVNSNYSS